MRLKEVLASQIAELVENGVMDFLSGMALGVDTICSELVLTQREKNPALKLHCILPCMGQDAKWTDSARKRYRSIIQRADSRFYVSREYHEGCMLERDRFLVERSDCLLAVYDGEQRGGTAATVRYAENMGRKVILIDPITLSVSHKRGGV